MENQKRIAIQDTYGERFQHCWGCGSKNDQGLHLKSYPSEDGKTCICKIVPDKKIYRWGSSKFIWGYDCYDI